MTDIKSMTKDELKNLMTELGEKPFRAKQIYSWLHEHLVTSYDEMGNIPGKLKEKLKDYPIAALEMVDEQVSAIDGTRKYLFRLSDGNVIESVLMRYKHGNSVCISSQVGCKMGCRFCASTIGGWTRNLLPSEMLDQIYRIQSITGERVSNVVVMGTGEPMDNYDHIVRFVHLLSDENGLNISQRNITVSTCGIVPKIYELAKEKLQITLPCLCMHQMMKKDRNLCLLHSGTVWTKSWMHAAIIFRRPAGELLLNTVLWLVLMTVTKMQES